MVKRKLVSVALVLTSAVALLGACTAAQVAQDVALGKELPCGPPVLADADREAVPVPPEVDFTQPEIDALLVGPPTTELDPSEAVMLLDDGDFPLVLGPAWPLQIAKVTPEEGLSGQCQFNLLLTEDGLQAMNEIAPLCVSRAAQCPSGQLAIVVDGRVLSAPTVQSPVFDTGELTITSGSGFTPNESLELTQAMARSAQFRPVIFDPRRP